jgi:hypothetical protein
MASAEAIKQKLTFSGHETFQCRHLWLKKGYDFILAGNSFKENDAVVKLGVGKNMVSSLRYWLKCFEIIDGEDNLTDFAHMLLADKGWDPYLEDEASLWLLHHKLVKKGIASAYTLIFNELRKEKIEFSQHNFFSLVNRKTEAHKLQNVSASSLLSDLTIFSKMYLRSDAQSKDKEDTFSGILTELDLVKAYGKGEDRIFVIENTAKDEIPDEVILYGILEMDNFDLSINLNNIEQDYNSPGSIFAINKTGLVGKLQNLSRDAKWIVFNDHAGIKEVQFKKKVSSLEILESYYNGK